MTALGSFIPAKEQEHLWNCTSELSDAPRSTTSLSGEEARRFYEGLTEGNDGVWRRGHAGSRDESVQQRRDAHRGKERRATSQRREPISGYLGGRGRISRGGGHQIQRTRTNVTAERRTGGAEESTQRHEGTRERRSRERAAHASSNRQAATSRPTELQGLRLLRCAQEGDLSGMKDLLSRGVDINFQDPFFWTAVMCASWSGQRAAVRLLLRRGAAWVGVVDLQGRDARELALTAGHQGVLEELDSHGRDTQRDTHPDNSVPQSQWCDVCGNQYSSSLSSHLSSTLHQFSLRRPPPTPQYCLPSSSASYKMMVRSGWNPRAGLGPEGAGPRQPVPTVLKRDQEGLGYGPNKRARVTHFQAEDPRAVKLPPKGREGRGDRGKRKEESRRKEERDRNWERDFRASFYL